MPVEVVRTFLLWTEIPARERLTEDIVRSFAKRNDYPDWWVDRKLELLVGNGCEIATRHEPFQQLYAPCGMPVADGAARCARHGGPSSTTRKQGKIDVLRTQLIEAGLEPRA